MNQKHPQISILLAVYNPNIEWFLELLDSLNKQDYPNIKLYVCNDCSPLVTHKEIESMVFNAINRFPVEVIKNEVNLGSNKTFEKLSSIADGEYFAYCDQDDIWHKNKLSLLQEEIEKKNAALVCSDMLCIDGSGKVFCDSIQKLRPLNKFRSGEGLTEGIFLSNFATGCALLIRAEIAKKAIPFCPYYYHDHYLTLFASLNGKIVALDDKLISYRIHGGNQTSALAGINNKEDWEEKKINKEIEKFEWMQEHFPCNKELKNSIKEHLTWMHARKEVLSGNASKIKTVKSYKQYNLSNSKIITFECSLCKAPTWLFNLGIWAYKKFAK